MTPEREALIWETWRGGRDRAVKAFVAGQPCVRLLHYKLRPISFIAPPAEEDDSCIVQTFDFWAECIRPRIIRRAPYLRVTCEGVVIEEIPL